MSLSSDTAPPADMTTAVQLRRDGAVAHVFLARPQARNALNLSMCLALRDIFETLDADDDVAVITISAEGPVFCAGADLTERQGKDETWVRRRRIASFVAYAAIERCNKPTVAFIEGPVIGSGGEISMACDFIVASTAASFRFPEPQ